MPINTLNNEKTKNIKKSLVLLSNQLKEQRRIAVTIQPYIYNGDELVPYVGATDFDTINKGITVLVGLILHFKSIDDFASIKKLRETELFFLRTEGLKEFKFPNYKLQINSVFLVYIEIESQLDSLESKSSNLSCRGYSLAASEAKLTAILLRSLNHLFFKEKRMGYSDYRARALEIINQSRPVLDQHRGYKKILGNLTLLILTLGTAFIVNKAVNGHFLFFQKTDSAKQIDAINQTLISQNQLSL